MALAANRDADQLLTAEVIGVVTDEHRRVFFRNLRAPDLWVLPAAIVPANANPRQALASVGLGTDLGPGDPLGVWKVAGEPRLLLGFSFTAATLEGAVPFPVGLAPLNADPGHLRIASQAVGGPRLADEFESIPGPQYLAWLREGEVEPDYSVGSARTLAEEMGVAEPRPLLTPSRHLLGEAESLIAAGDWARARWMLSQGAEDEGLDEVSRLKCALRLEEIESEDGVLFRAWSELSTSSARQGRHLDVILSHLAFAAARRRRRREAEAYLRRALGVCENHARRAAINYALAKPPAGLLSVSA